MHLITVKCTKLVCVGSTPVAIGGALWLPCSGSKESMKSRLGCKGMSPGWIMSAFPA